MRECIVPNPRFFDIDEWQVQQTRFDEKAADATRTIFAQSNGYQGIQGLLEESESSDARQSGGFIAGLYEKQIGIEAFIKGKPILPDCFCRVANVPNFLHISFSLDDNVFSESSCEPYARRLDLQTGEVIRKAVWKTDDGRETEVRFCRAVSLKDPNLFISTVTLKPINHTGRISIESTLDANVVSSYLGKGIWQDVSIEISDDGICGLSARTQHSRWQINMLASHRLNCKVLTENISRIDRGATLAHQFKIQKGETYCFEKLVWSEALAPGKKTNRKAGSLALSADATSVLTDNRKAWADFWNDCDIRIEGDEAAQQGIRYALFQLRQAYRSGLDVSVTAKGLTGEGYGLLCFWDAEIYLLPFYIYTYPDLAREALTFRYRILDKARERAKAMGYKGAMFPWMTIHGEDNPGAWECVLGEQHINAAIPYAIQHYLEVTGDEKWMTEIGAEIFIENARFWASRIFLNKTNDQYVITQVTGPDEYTEMVNNDCYTNMMAAWTLENAARTVTKLKTKYPQLWKCLAKKIKWSDKEELNWTEIADNIYIPWNKMLGIHPQDDGFLGLDDIDINDIPKEDFALEGNWAWPNVLRYKLLKQPSVILANFLLPDWFSPKEKKAEYEYYEPKTTHDSSLSPSIHSIMAAELNKGYLAYDYFMRSVRLDLDDPKEDGVHLANAGGAWMAMINGFAGLRMIKANAFFDPKIPSKWKSYSFGLKIKGRQIRLNVTRNEATFTLISGESLEIYLKGKKCLLKETLIVKSAILKC